MTLPFYPATPDPTRPEREARRCRERRLVVVEERDWLEVRAARNLIEEAGLKVERRGTEVHVSVERTLAPEGDKR